MYDLSCLRILSSGGPSFLANGFLKDHLGAVFAAVWVLKSAGLTLPFGRATGRAGRGDAALATGRAAGLGLATVRVATALFVAGRAPNKPGRLATTLGFGFGLATTLGFGFGFATTLGFGFATGFGFGFGLATTFFTTFFGAGLTARFTGARLATGLAAAIGVAARRAVDGMRTASGPAGTYALATASSAARPRMSRIGNSIPSRFGALSAVKFPRDLSRGLIKHVRSALIWREQIGK